MSLLFRASDFFFAILQLGEISEWTEGGLMLKIRGLCSPARGFQQAWRTMEYTQGELWFKGGAGFCRDLQEGAQGSDGAATASLDREGKNFFTISHQILPLAAGTYCPLSVTTNSLAAFFRYWKATMSSPKASLLHAIIDTLIITILNSFLSASGVDQCHEMEHEGAVLFQMLWPSRMEKQDQLCSPLAWPVAAPAWTLGLNLPQLCW